MGLFTQNTFNNLNDLLIEQLQDLYDAEHRLTEALPKMRDAATASELKLAFDMHLEETWGHVRRLENIFSHIAAPLSAPRVSPYRRAPQCCLPYLPH